MLAEEITRGWGAPANSAVMISLKARPTQPRESSPLRFSRRRTARRSAGVPAGWRMQPVKNRESKTGAKNHPRGAGTRACSVESILDASAARSSERRQERSEEHTSELQ